MLRKAAVNLTPPLLVVVNIIKFSLLVVLVAYLILSSFVRVLSDVVLPVDSLYGDMANTNRL